MHDVKAGSGLHASGVPFAGTRTWSSRRLDSRIVVLGMLALVALALRAPLFGNPVIHADEQFYLLVGDRMLHGALPYVDIWDRKPIGLFLIYAGLRSLGGDGILQYQIAATVCAVLTAFLIRDIARPLTSGHNAFLGAVAYLAYLLVFDGAGGQSPVFYNLIVIVAVRLFVGLKPDDGSGTHGTAKLLAVGAMVNLLFGIAIQIKYTPVFEGVYFGLVLWVRAAKTFRSPLQVLAAVTVWVACALAPSAAAMLVYYQLGHLGDFVQANFLSVFNRHQALPPALLRLVLAALALAPLAGSALRGALRVEGEGRDLGLRLVLLGWALSAIAGYLIFGSYYDHYALPLLPPLCVLGALGFGGRHRLFNERVTLALALLVGVLMTGWRYYSNGTSHQMDRLTALVDANLHGCLWVYEGPSILYQQTGACFVSRYVFPSHLDNNKEADAVGVDTLAETARVLRGSPSVIVMSAKSRSLTNFATRALVLQAVRQRYRLAGEITLGERRVDVYALRAPRVG